jgi:hypothetical protein
MPSLRVALLVAAFVLAVSSRGDVVVLALLLGLGSASRASGFGTATALAAAMVRWGSPSMRAIAGAQAVLGPGGWTGSGAAVASAWLAGLALVAAARPSSRPTPVWTVIAVAPFAAAAADVVAGPSTGGAIAARVAGSVVALGLGIVVSRWRRAPRAACLLGTAALLAAGFAR